VNIRPATHADVDGVLALWEVGRTAHATTEDRRVDVERVLEQEPGALILAEQDDGIPRVQALVGREDEDAAAFWTSAGYPVEPGTARHVRNVLLLPCVQFVVEAAPRARALQRVHRAGRA